MKHALTSLLGREKTRFAGGVSSIKVRKVEPWICDPLYVLVPGSSI
jgi:hypothetical protein